MDSSGNRARISLRSSAANGVSGVFVAVGIGSLSPRIESRPGVRDRFGCAPALLYEAAGRPTPGVDVASRDCLRRSLVSRGRPRVSPEAAPRPGVQTCGMTDRRFRFGVVAGERESAMALADRARGWESQGFATVLFPDTSHTLSPALAAAAVATASPALHCGPHVLSVANRTPGLVASETATLATLAQGRYELGLGIGRPGADT